MSSLAVLLKQLGEDVSGCDSAEVFYTDALLEENHINFSIGFEVSLLPADCQIVIHSSVYSRTLPILQRAFDEKKQLYTYVEFLSFLSHRSESYVVCGSHGKTTACATTGYLLSRGKRTKYPFFCIYGSHLTTEKTFPCQGRDYFLLEGCEYQDHFLSYKTRGALVTNIEYDHPDYFANEEAVYESFCRFVSQMDKGGFLICCSDSQYSKRLARYCQERRNDLQVLTYGFNDKGPFRIQENRMDDSYSLSLIDNIHFTLPFYGRPLADDLVGAALLATAMLLDSKSVNLYLDDDVLVTEEVLPTVLSSMLYDLKGYPGTVGRLESIAVDDKVTYIDDYAHHPSQIKASLESLRLKYPNHSILVVFCPHTASRTKALFKDFVSALSLCDKVIIQSTYASARNDKDEGKDSALMLVKGLQDRMLRNFRNQCSASVYAQSEEEAVSLASAWLLSGDLCITMGAGNNRFLIEKIREKRRSIR